MKPRLIFRGPVLTASGYGVHSRQLLKALLDAGDFDISLIPINWGNTSFIYNENDEFFSQFRKLSIKCEEERAAGVTYDVSVQVTIPNEFERMARFNIGVTAGIEVDRVSPVWIDKANEMVDLVVVPSHHSAQVYAGARYNLPNGNTLMLKKNMAVCPEGVDTSVFNPSASQVLDLKFESPFNYLCVGLGMDKSPGEDRKNISNLVKWFCERFNGDENVGLVLKMGIVNNSSVDFDVARRRIKELKTSVGCGEMASLYTQPTIKAFVSLTHGEGFGLPLLEAVACNLPVVAVDWSGHRDFLYVENKKRFVSLDFDLAEIPESAVWEGVMEKGSKWANVKEDHVKTQLKKLVLSYDTPKKWAEELGAHVRNKFAVTRTNRDFATLVREAFKMVAVPQQSHNERDMVADARSQLQVPEGRKTLLFTMPQSGGDVFVSTAVVDSLAKKFPEHLIYFATNQQYVDILKDNKNIFKVLAWENWMADVPLCEKIFDEVYTPNLAIQLNTSNWVHGGKGRRLADEIAAQCQVELGDYQIKTEPVEGLPQAPYIVFNPGSGKGQWEARNYLNWQEVIDNIKRLLNFTVLQVGVVDDPLYDGVIDFRGKTNYNQLAYAIDNSELVLGIDSITSHFAAGLGTPQVSLYGSSYAGSTGPIYKENVIHRLIETKNRFTCDKACYKYTCSVNKDVPCINEISGYDVVDAVLSVVGYGESKLLESRGYVESSPKLVGYTTILNGEEHDFPYMESIRSMLGFCNEVVVLDGGSTDGTYEKLLDLASVQSRLKVEQRKWDWEEPGMDGAQKALARTMCEVEEGRDFLWQQDCDEVVHEEDYDKIRNLVKRFPRDVDLMHLPVIELWGKSGKVRTDRHSWKWRLSRASWKITHGIHKDAKVLDPKTGRTYAKKGMSDGCEYVDVMTGEYTPHKGFYNQDLERLRRFDPDRYGQRMNELFAQLPSVYHYSWFDLDRKIRNFKKFWNKCWSNLYNDSAPVDRFPDVETDEQISAKAAELLARGGEHDSAKTFDLKRSQPIVMSEWIGRRKE
jgi:ADP-heptose:LPS heptosyltransferase